MRSHRSLPLAAFWAALATACLVGVLTPGQAAAVGGLTQKSGGAACISASGTGGACTVGTELDDARAVAVSPDGTSAYVAANDSDAVLTFARANDGTLTQQGCVSDLGVDPGCTDGAALDGAYDVTVSPDGKNVYAVSYDESAVTIFDRNPADGALTQKSGTDGCISETGSGSACTDGTALGSASAVTVSPDGTSVYVTGYIPGSVAVFDRAGDGKLTQKSGTDACISQFGSGGDCVDGRALGGSNSITLSADGTSAYIAAFNDDAVATFTRASDGTLTQKLGSDGCTSEDVTLGSCTTGTGLDGAASVALSPDGTSAYVAAFGSDAVSVYDRTADGVLTRKAGTTGCVSDGGSAACADGTGLNGPSGITVSPDGKSAYAASRLDGAVIFDRAADGGLTQKSDPDGCVTVNGSGSQGGTCTAGSAVNGATGVAVSPDGASTYFAARFGDAVAIFDRDPGSADLVIAKTGSRQAVTVGDQVTYTLAVTNQGPDGATGVVVTDVLPAGVAFVSAPGCSNASGTVTCALGGLGSGAPAQQVQIVVTATTTGTITNTATVTGDQPDPSLADNTSSATTQVSSTPTGAGGGTTSSPSAPPPPPPTPAPPAPTTPFTSPPVTPPAPPSAAKLEIKRASVLRSKRRLSVLAPITGRASGSVKAEFEAAGTKTRFSAKVDAKNRRLLIKQRIPAKQARKGTGILTLTYPGDADTQPQEVRLRAASGKARLAADRPVLKGNRLTAKGKISSRARGVVRLQVLYEPAGQDTEILEYTGRIRDGAYKIDEKLSNDLAEKIAGRRGVVHTYTLFTGYEPRRIRGEMRSFQILPAP